MLYNAKEMDTDKVYSVKTNSAKKSARHCTLQVAKEMRERERERERENDNCCRLLAVIKQHGSRRLPHDDSVKSLTTS